MGCNRKDVRDQENVRENVRKNVRENVRENVRDQENASDTETHV
jgi:hypothetical protein